MCACLCVLGAIVVVTTMVPDIKTGERVRVPTSKGAMSGPRCGSGSSMNIYRRSMDASNLDSHTTGQDVGVYLELQDGPACADSQLELVENGCDFDRPDRIANLGQALKAGMEARGYQQVTSIQDSYQRGGPEKRLRYYGANIRRCDDLGSLF